MTLDENQKQIIQRFSSNSDASLFIYGCSGSGKTLIATQVLDMLATQSKKQKQEVRIIVMTYYSAYQELLLDMQNKYLASYKDKAEFTMSGVRFYVIIIHPLPLPYWDSFG